MAAIYMLIITVLQFIFFSMQSWKLYLEKLTSSLNIHYSSHLVAMSCWNICRLLNFSGKNGIDTSHTVIYNCVHWHGSELETIWFWRILVHSVLCLLSLTLILKRWTILNSNAMHHSHTFLEWCLSILKICIHQSER